VLATLTLGVLLTLTLGVLVTLTLGVLTTLTLGVFTTWTGWITLWPNNGTEATQAENKDRAIAHFHAF
jgi:hypothetical protein